MPIDQPEAPQVKAPTQAMGVEQVQAALDQLDLGIRIIEFDGSTATSQQAAERVGCQLGQIVKSLGFMINKTRPVLVLSSGDQTIDERKLAALYGVGRKRARMMNAERCLAVLGYAPGGVPPIGLRSRDLEVVMDETLKRYNTVYAAGGSARALFPIKLSLLQRATRGRFADLARA